MAATPLADHRLAYLDYEGPLSDNRGSVARWDHGEFHWLHRSVDRIEVCLAGQVLRGAAALRKSDESDDWIYRFVADVSPDSV